MALAVPGRLRPRIITTFGTTSVVGRQPNTLAAFTPYSFSEAESTSGHMVLSEETTEKILSDTTGIDPETLTTTLPLCREGIRA